jgi:hypothetical protein
MTNGETETYLTIEELAAYLKLAAPNSGKTEPKQGEINFTPEFEGL